MHASESLETFVVVGTRWVSESVKVEVNASSIDEAIEVAHCHLQRELPKRAECSRVYIDYAVGGVSVTHGKGQ